MQEMIATQLEKDIPDLSQSPSSSGPFRSTRGSLQDIADATVAVTAMVAMTTPMSDGSAKSACSWGTLPRPPSWMQNAEAFSNNPWEVVSI